MIMKKLGILFILAGTIGFIAATQYKNTSEVFKKRVSLTGTHTLSVPVAAGSTYVFFFWGVDEESGLQAWANMAFAATVSDSAGNVLFKKRTSASASSSEEKGGIRRAQNGFEYHYKGHTAEPLTITLSIEEGDYVDVAVYKDISDLANILPGLFIIAGIIGVVLYIKGRAAVTA